jgi:hypothetical protein
LGVGRPKSKKIVSAAARRLRLTVGLNLKRLVAREWPGKSLTFGYERIGEATGFSLSTLQRVAAGSHGCEIDTLADIAKALGCTAAELCEQHPDSSHKEPPPEPPAPASRRQLQRMSE